MPWPASILVTTEQMVINVFNQIREPIPDNPEPMQRTCPRASVPWKHCFTTLWISQVSVREAKLPVVTYEKGYILEL